MLRDIGLNFAPQGAAFGADSLDGHRSGHIGKIGRLPHVISFVVTDEKGGGKNIARPGGVERFSGAGRHNPALALMKNGAALPVLSNN